MINNSFSKILVTAEVLKNIALYGPETLLYPGAHVSGIYKPDEEWMRNHWSRRVFYVNGVNIRGWLIRRPEDRPRLVVVFGGNRDNMGDYIERLEQEQSRSYLFFNHRGYGDSDGYPREKDIIQDAIAIVQQVQKELNPRSLTLVGYSLGTGVAMQVAPKVHPDKMVLICPFDSVLNIANRIIPVLSNLILRDTFDSAAHAKDIHCPVSIYVAEKDDCVKWENTERLIDSFERDIHVRRFPAGHGDIWGLPWFHQAILDALDADKPTLSQELLQRAKAGDSNAQYQVGDFHYNAYRYGEAVYWYNRSAAQGNHWGQFNMGKCYRFGHGVEQSDDKAREWYDKSAAAGNECALVSKDKIG